MSETEFLQAAEDAAIKAAEVLGEWSEKFTVSEKNPSDLVTEADVAAQDAIHALISGRFPDHNFLGEEGLSETDGDSPYRWVIDPLDGTSNYVHGFPYYSVSIALECEGRLIIGVIYDPNRDEMFSAVAGRGATLNGQPIAPTKVNALGEAMIVVSLRVNAGPEDVTVARFLRVMAAAQTVQRLGSAALNLCYVAAGRMDGYFATSLKPWDVAAGALIVAEAGGQITKLHGDAHEIEVPDMLATNGGALHDEMVEFFQNEPSSPAM